MRGRRVRVADTDPLANATELVDQRPLSHKPYYALRIKVKGGCWPALRVRTHSTPATPRPLHDREQAHQTPQPRAPPAARSTSTRPGSSWTSIPRSARTGPWTPTSCNSSRLTSPPATSRIEGRSCRSALRPRFPGHTSSRSRTGYPSSRVRKPRSGAWCTPTRTNWRSRP